MNTPFNIKNGIDAKIGYLNLKTHNISLKHYNRKIWVF